MNQSCGVRAESRHAAFTDTTRQVLLINVTVGCFTVLVVDIQTVTFFKNSLARCG